MKKVFTQRGLSPYEAPDAEVIDVFIEDSILSGERTSTSSTEELEEAEGWGQSIWN